MLTTTFHPIKQLKEKYTDSEILSELFDREKNGLITIQKLNRYLQFTYSKEVPFNKQWDEFTSIARGIIFDDRLKIWYLTYAKFFNHSELTEEQRPKTPICEVANKYDGSLIIIFFDWETTEWRFATKGSFNSEQAQWAAKWFAEKPIDLNPHVTYLAEALYPENQIVVKYDWVGMVFTGAYRNNGFDEINLEEHFDSVKLYDRYKLRETYPITSLEKISELLKQKNFEGVVVKHTCGTRVKFKSEEYCALHKLVTGVTQRRVWELLYNEMTNNPDDMSISQWKKNVPEEFWPEVDEWANEYLIKAVKHLAQANSKFMDLCGLSTRKEFALEAKKEHPIVSTILFMMLDGKTDRLDRKVMEMMRP